MLLITDLFLFLFLLSLKIKKVYIPHFKGNYKEKTYFARLDNGKSCDVDAEVSKPKSKPTARVQKKSVFVPTFYLCGVVDRIRQIVLCWENLVVFYLFIFI